MLLLPKYSDSDHMPHSLPSPTDDMTVRRKEPQLLESSSENRTLAAYDQRADEFFHLYEAQSEPPLKSVFQRWIVKGSSILELGCGSGRDARWLARHGMHVLATDGSSNMLNAAADQANKTAADCTSGSVTFAHLCLPATARSALDVKRLFQQRLSTENPLEASSAFDCVLAVGVLQHLNDNALTQTATFLEAAVSHSGILIISVPTDHPGDSPTVQSSLQRCYFNRPAEHYSALLERFGFAEIQRENTLHTGSPGHECTWATMIFAKAESRRQARTNLSGILENDRKTSTYKFALLRALCDINIQNPGRVRYIGKSPNGQPFETVALPFELVIERVIEYYWQIFANAKHLPMPPGQIAGRRRLAFNEKLELVMRDYCYDWQTFQKEFYDGSLASSNLSDRKVRVLELFDCTAESLKKGPVYFSGNSLGETARRADHNRLFCVSRTRNNTSVLTPHQLTERYGELFIPSNIWRELNFSAPFVIDTILLQWAKLSRRFSELQQHNYSLGQILEMMLPTNQQRDVALADALFRKRIQSGETLCVWSQRPLTLKTLAIDHVLPWSRLHTNDLWNLVPSYCKANGSKSDLIPSTNLLLSSQNRIIENWHVFENSSLGGLFRAQAENSLIGKTLPKVGWEIPLFDALLSTAEYVARQFGANRWDGFEQEH